MSAAIAPAREFDVRASDGRLLHGYEAGDPAGALVIVHHGTPCSGLLAGPWAEDARARGIRLVGFDRAGYGRSERHAGRAVADVVSDTAAIADDLGVRRFRTWGVSGGGPHVLACAALLPERVVAAVCLAGVAPYGAEGLDWMAGMGQDNVEEFGAALAGEQALRDFLARQRAGLLDSTPQNMAEEMASLLPPVDKAVLSGELAGFMHAWMTSGLAADYIGWLDDDLAFTRDWGFDLADIAVPVRVVQGEHDLMVPYAHGQWLGDHVPGVEVELSPEDGHLTLLTDIGRTHAWLMDHS
jgi:pimeloyl-ACP methyl ester carboxylesterase